MQAQSRMMSPDPVIPALINIIKGLIKLIPSFGVFVVFIIPYMMGRMVYGRPPIVPSLTAFLKMFHLLLFNTCKERNYFTYKLRMFIYFIQTLLLQPAYGVMWYLDDVLFPGYRSVKIDKPCLIIGDARTGTTQYVQTLGDDDQNFCAPITLNALIPLILPWKFGAFISSLMSKSVRDQAEKICEAVYFSWLPTEFQTRHEGGLWRPDTFEVQYSAWRIEFFMQLIDMDLTAKNWWFPGEEQREDFLRFLDAVWKKVYYHRGRAGQKMLIKGHFLKECPALATMYPGAFFVALARDPAPRLESQINFLWNGPWASQAGVPRAVLKDLTKVLTDRVIEYSEEERLFFPENHPNRISIPFEGYVKEIDVSIKKTYSLCGLQVPAKMEARLSAMVEEHRNWRQTRPQHSPDLTLKELGVDTAELNRKHEKYMSRTFLPKK